MLLPKAGLYMALSTAILVSGCVDKEAMLDDTLYFAPGTPLQYNGKSVKLYGTEACSHGALSGNSCLILPPHRPTSTAVLVAEKSVEQINVTAKRDPHNPTRYIVVDDEGQRLLSTDGHSHDMANINIAY